MLTRRHKKLFPIFGEASPTLNDSGSQQTTTTNAIMQKVPIYSYK